MIPIKGGEVIMREERVEYPLSTNMRGLEEKFISTNRQGFPPIERRNHHG